MPSYATEAELVAYLPVGIEVSDADRLLARASELLDSVVTAYFEVDGDLPVDVVIAGAMRDAACAQVEFWLEVGEEHDVTGLRGSVSIGQLQIEQLPATLAPRAKRILGAAGLFADADLWVWP